MKIKSLKERRKEIQIEITVLNREKDLIDKLIDEMKTIKGEKDSKIGFDYNKSK